MLLGELRAFVRANVAPHLQGLWNTDIESQVIFDAPDGRKRIPHDGDGAPNYDDTAYHPPMAKLTALGCTGWNWMDGRSVYCTIDVDGLNHADGHTAETLDDLVRRLTLVDQVEIIRSKSGRGYHVRLYFDPEALPIAHTRKAHISNCLRALTWLSSRIGHDLEAKSDAVGVVAWIYHTERAENGFQLVKQSTAFMPDGWDSEFPQHVKTGAAEAPEHVPLPLTPKHQELIDWLTRNGRGEWKNGRLVTHTYSLLLASQDKALKVKGSFSTLATGKDGPSDRNCFCYPDADGSWRVYRLGPRGKPTKEHESWWRSSGGFTTCWFNRSKEEKVCPANVLVALAEKDELFHDATGRTFTSTTIRGIRETLQLSDPQYRAKLRLAFTEHTGRIVSGDALATAIDQLAAVAMLQRPEYPVAIRLSEHDGALFIDLANTQRQIVRVTPAGWSIVDDSPVRFLRPFGLLPLPVPLPGGSLAELRQFVNVENEDLPLLLAFVVGCFHPSGPYGLLQVVGEQGSAKSSLMRLIHDFVDPNMAVGNTLPRDERDLLVAAQLRWLVSFDNVSEISKKLSGLLCMLVTGAASANRKLFTDDAQSILKAKRPVVVTAIANVVTASDLLDRTLTLVLPTIPPENRKSEFAISQELRRDGVRGRIFGFILDGVAAALAGHANVQRDDMPRMADLFSWATAAEPAYGLEPGSAIEAVKRQASEESGHAVESPFAKAIIGLCREGFSGSAAEIAARIPELDLSARQVGSLLREIAPDLRRLGHYVKLRKSNGNKIVELSASGSHLRAAV